MIYRRRVPFFVGLVVVVGLLLALFAPLPYVLIKPGPAQDVLGSNITIENASSKNLQGNRANASERNGRLYSVAVLVSTPQAYLTGVDVAINWIEGSSVVLPRADVYPKQITTKQDEAESAKAMVDSQSAAKAAAINFLRGNFPDASATLSQQGISIHLKDTGGPSAGLAFALGIIAKVAPEDLVGNRLIGATGTITPAGVIGPIGGIDQKLITARRAGATLFLAPFDNCRDITRIPSGLRVVPVSTLNEAVSLLREGNSASLPACPSH